LPILYDIQLASGELINGCYFVKFEKSIKGGRGNVTLTYGVHELRCYDRHGNEIKGINFENARVIRIFDEHTHENLTKQFMEKYKQVALALGYEPLFPVPRKTIFLD
jgi:hypothetical protein